MKFTAPEFRKSRKNPQEVQLCALLTQLRCVLAHLLPPCVSISVGHDVSRVVHTM